jgi:hypothetical protein
MDTSDLYVLAYMTDTLPFGLLLLKGRVKMFLLMLPLAFVPVLGTVSSVVVSVRLGKPNSWWARRFYGTQKLKESRLRYADAPSEPANMSAIFGWAILLLFGPVGMIAALFF